MAKCFISTKLRWTTGPTFKLFFHMFHFQIVNSDHFVQLIGTRFVELHLLELATDLITPIVLHETANRCPRLQYLTLGKDLWSICVFSSKEVSISLSVIDFLDFSTAMQLHDFTDLQSFPSRLRALTLCLSENIFLEGFLRKVYTFISSVEILHIFGECELRSLKRNRTIHS